MINATILCVDDDCIYLNILIRTFKNKFKTVLTATDGKKALELFKNNDIDIIITDISMPIMNGVEFITEIRKIDNKVPIIIISAFNSSLLKFNTNMVQKIIYKPSTGMNVLMEIIDVYTHYGDSDGI